MRSYHKYGARKTEYDGKVFASKLEASCYIELRLSERSGEIKDLQWQVPMPLVVNGVTICKYIADFTFQRKTTISKYEYVVRDAKGYITPEFRIKWKLAQALYPAFSWELWPLKKKGSTQTLND